MDHTDLAATPLPRPIPAASAVAAVLATIIALAACAAPTDPGSQPPPTTTSAAPASPTGVATSTPTGMESPTAAATPIPDDTGPVEGKATAVLGDATIVLAHTGGCMMAGPNCPVWHVAADGSFEVRRLAGDDLLSADVEGTGQVDDALVSQVREAAAQALADDLLDRIGPGTCNGCVDGIDLLVAVATDDGVLAMDSMEHDFDDRHPIFGALGNLEDQLGAATDLPLQMRE